MSIIVPNVHVLFGGQQTLLGYDTVHPTGTTTGQRRAQQLVVPVTGTISQIVMWHEAGGTGSWQTAIYDDTGSDAPDNRLGISAETAISASAVWEESTMLSPVAVTLNQKIWLAWVYENNPGIKYDNGTPGRYSSSGAWGSSQMPDPWGVDGSIGSFIYSIYCYIDH